MTQRCSSLALSSAHPKEIKLLKNLSSDLKKAVDDFTKLDDSECEDYWMSFFVFWLVLWPDYSPNLPVPGRKSKSTGDGESSLRSAAAPDDLHFRVR